MANVVMTAEEVRELVDHKMQSGEWDETDEQIKKWYELMVFIMNKALMPHIHDVTPADVAHAKGICNAFIVDAYNHGVDVAMFSFAETFEGGFGEGRKFRFTPKLSAEWAAIREAILN